MTSGEARWALTLRAAELLAVDPGGLGGVVLRGAAGPVRDRWLDCFKALLPPQTPWRRIPPQVAEGRLLGGLDLAATLAAGRPVAERGLLAEASGGIVVVPMAERLEANIAGHLSTALDTGEIIVERDGIALRAPAHIAAVLLDEGIDDERRPDAVAERLAFAIALDGLRLDDTRQAGVDASQIAAARERLAEVRADDTPVEALAAAGLAFGVPSLRIATLALRTAKASAALAGRDRVDANDAEIAAALVIAPRATALPASDDPGETEDRPPPQPEPQPGEDPSPDASQTQSMADRVVEAAQAAIPADLLATLGAAAGQRKATAAGRGGALQKSVRHGRPAGTRRGAPAHGARLAVVETLRAAAPWQRLRCATMEAAPARIQVRREDFRVGRFKERSESLTIFVVDASGSAALHRLAEAKGAVELILAECYVRRDSVALIAFRGERADLVLPPTRSLTRAKRALAGHPGGGGTPLAAAIDASRVLAEAAVKGGRRPFVVLMTDGKANISRSGRPGRSEAEADAASAARAFRLGGTAGLVLDIAPRPGEAAARLAAAMGARYIPLPYADAQLVSRAVMSAGPGAQAGGSNR